MPPKDADTNKPAAKKPNSRKAPAGDGVEKVPKKAKPNEGKKKQKVRSEVIEGQSSASTESGFELRSALDAIDDLPSKVTKRSRLPVIPKKGKEDPTRVPLSPSPTFASLYRKKVADQADQQSGGSTKSGTTFNGDSEDGSSQSDDVDEDDDDGGGGSAAASPSGSESSSGSASSKGSPGASEDEDSGSRLDDPLRL
eukprot:SAG11_NODE_4243_length_1989_cov_3.512698_1_plen_197_part_00